MNLHKICVLTIALIVCPPSLFADEGVKTVIKDSEITAEVKTKLLANKSTSGLQIHVQTKNGVVSLSGNAHTESEVNKAIELATETTGVQDVDISKLNVDRSIHPLADSVITSKIKGTYLREKLFGDKPVAVATVHVETKDGVVYLTGKVDSQKKAKIAADLAKSIKGVKEVKSSIEIE